MPLSDFDYHLPPDLIAQTPLEPRHAARLMVIDRVTERIEHRQFRDLPDYLEAGDLLMVNNSRVLSARLLGVKESGGKMEVLLLKPLSDRRWEALVGGKRLREGTRFMITPRYASTDPVSRNETAQGMVQGRIVQVLSEARRIVEFNQPLQALLPQIGHVPLPPYIQNSLSDPERYQTVYSQIEGSAAAPTAGLHFSAELLLALRQQGIKLSQVTLHVGLDTFKPVTVEQIEHHPLHSEWASLSAETAKQINETKLAGRKLVAVGTTSVRVLETAALRGAGVRGSLQGASQADFLRPDICPWKSLVAFEAPTDLFIYPGFQFSLVDRLVTNFHLPKSSLLMLVAAFMGLNLMQEVYQVAIAERYRFYSFGDAMLIL